MPGKLVLLVIVPESRWGETLTKHFFFHNDFPVGRRNLTMTRPRAHRGQRQPAPSCSSQDTGNGFTLIHKFSPRPERG